MGSKKGRVLHAYKGVYNIDAETGREITTDSAGNPIAPKCYMGLGGKHIVSGEERYEQLLGTDGVPEGVVRTDLMSFKERVEYELRSNEGVLEWCRRLIG